MKPAAWPLDPHRKLAVFGSDDQESWRRLCGATVEGDGTSVRFEELVSAAYIVIGYDDDAPANTDIVTYIVFGNGQSQIPPAK